MISLEQTIKALLKIRTPWATGVIVLLAIFSGLLFNAIMPSLMLDSGHTEQSGNQQLAMAPPPKPASALEEEEEVKAPVPQTNTSEQPKSVAGTNTIDHTTPKQCDIQTYQQALAAENERHEAQLKEISSISRLLSKVGLGQDKKAAENQRHAKALEDIKNSYEKTGC